MKKYNLIMAIMLLMMHSLTVNGMYYTGRRAANTYRQTYMRPSQNVQEVTYRAPYAGQIQAQETPQIQEQETPQSWSPTRGMHTKLSKEEVRKQKQQEGGLLNWLWYGRGAPSAKPSPRTWNPRTQSWELTKSGPSWNPRTSTWSYPVEQEVAVETKPRSLLYGERYPEVKQQQEGGWLSSWFYGSGKPAEQAVVQEAEVATPPAKSSWSGWRPWRGTRTSEEYRAQQREKSEIGRMLYGPQSQTSRNQLITLLNLGPWTSEQEIERVYQEKIEGVSIPQVRRMSPKARPAAVAYRNQLNTAYENYRAAQESQRASE